MNLKFFGKTVSVFVIAVIMVYSCVWAAGSARIVIKGSTTVLPITQKTSEEYRKQNNVSISIEGSGSGNGIKALLDGTCDIANSSREILRRRKG